VFVLHSLRILNTLKHRHKRKSQPNRTYDCAVEEVETQTSDRKNMTVMENQTQQQQEGNKGQLKRCQRKKASSSCYSRINNLDDGCLMHIFSFLPPIPGIDLFPLKILIFL
jgi:hypothetical protein